MEQTQCNLWFRWFVGLSMDDAVWVPTVFTKNRERLIEHDALIQAWVGHKSFCRKDGGDDGSKSGYFKGEGRSSDTHESSTDADARLYCKGDNASRLRYMGHTLADNRHGLIANAMVTAADGFAEREAAKAIELTTPGRPPTTRRPKSRWVQIRVMTPKSSLTPFRK